MRDRLGQLRLRFAELRLVSDGARVQVYGGKDFSGYEVSVAVLAEQVAADQRLRGEFAEAAGRARTGGAAGVQSDVHAPVPWFAVRHPDGYAAIHRFVAELERHHPTMPAGSLSLAPLPVDPPPPPVRPDPTVAPPPVDLRPVTAPPPTPMVPPAPSPPRPAPRTSPPVPRSSPPVPAPRHVGPPHHQPRVPAGPARPSMSRTTIATIVVVGLVLLAMCCSSGLADLLG